MEWQAKLCCCAQHTEVTLGSRWVHIPYHSTVSRTFHSLFKVLFIFRSLYLFAIGLVPIFSLVRGISDSWSCILKQPDSCSPLDAATRRRGRNAAITLRGVPFQATLPPTRAMPRAAYPTICQLQRTSPGNSGMGLLGCSLAVTNPIVVTFFSWAY